MTRRKTAAPARRGGSAQTSADRAGDTFRAFIRTLETLDRRRSAPGVPPPRAEAAREDAR